MAAQNASHDSPAQPGKDEPVSRGRDGRKATHNDRSNATTNNPPDHGLPTHGPGRFLWEQDPDTPVEELGARYRNWRRKRRNEQTSIEGWD